MSVVAVVGNTTRNLGAACAADLALAGHQVRYAVFPEQTGQLAPLRAAGGFVVQGDPEQLVARRTGLAALEAIAESPQEALRGAEIAFIDVATPELEKRFAGLIPALARGAVVHVQSHGYWPAARLTPLLRSAGRDDVLVTEAAAPTHAAGLDNGVLTAQSLRRGIEVATVPGARINAALERLRSCFPYLQPAPSVLQTGLENINLMVHPAMALLGIGLFERAGLDGHGVRFYRECNVPAAGKLADALDHERAGVCAAYGVRHKPIWTAIDSYYGTRGTNSYDAVSNCAVYQAVGEMPSTTWSTWMSVDVPYAIVPLVRLAEQAAVAAPLHRALTEILGTVLGMDPWRSSPSLESMNLAGPPAEVVRRTQRGS